MTGKDARDDTEAPCDGSIAACTVGPVEAGKLPHEANDVRWDILMEADEHVDEPGAHHQDEQSLTVRGLTKEEADRLEAETKAATAAAVAQEEAAVAAQEAAAGCRAIRRLQGPPNSATIDVAARTVAVVRNGGFPTVGMRSMAVAAPAKAYFEVTLVAAKDVMQIGWADADAFEPHNLFSGSGVGDDAHSWAVDGIRQKKWGNGSNSDSGAVFGDLAGVAPFGSKWKDGDVIGIAADLSGGKACLSFSVNGSFAAPDGVAFENVEVGAGGLFPALTISMGTIKYNFGEEPFKFAPPWEQGREQ